MRSPFLGGRRTAAICWITLIAAILLPGLATPCGAQTSNARSAAWNDYSHASRALAKCRLQGHTAGPCVAEKQAAIAAEARYRAEIGAAAPTTTGH